MPETTTPAPPEGAFLPVLTPAPPPTDMQGLIDAMAAGRLPVITAVDLRDYHELAKVQPVRVDQFEWGTNAQDRLARKASGINLLAALVPPK